MREKALTTLNNAMPITDVDSASQAAGAISTLTDKPDEVSNKTNKHFFNILSTSVF